MINILVIAAIAILFLVSIFWSASETALTSLSKYKIKKLIVVNKSFALPLKQWLSAPYYMLTIILVGNTLTSLAISALSTIAAGNIFSFVPREIIEIATWLIGTFLLLLFAEITPKIFAKNNPEKVTLFSLPILSHIARIIYPMLWLFRKIFSFFPKLNIVPFNKKVYVSLEEIKGLISESSGLDALGSATSQMLEHAVNFSNLEVSKIMTPIAKVDAVNIACDEDKFIDRVVEAVHSRVPVYNSNINKIIGFAHTKDLLWAWRHNHGNFSGDLIHPPYFVPIDKKISDLLNDFKSGKTHMAFVKDAFGSVVGIVTLEDVLEEIVGNILDEYDLKERIRQ
jgi:putative hemolysin